MLRIVLQSPFWVHAINIPFTSAFRIANNPFGNSVICTPEVEQLYKSLEFNSKYFNPEILTDGIIV